MLLPLSTRSEFKKSLRAAPGGVKSAMKDSQPWAAAMLNVGVTEADDGRASSQSSTFSAQPWMPVLWSFVISKRERDATACMKRHQAFALAPVISLM